MSNYITEPFDGLSPAEKLKLLNQKLGNSSDLVHTELFLGKFGQLQLHLLYMKGITATNEINGIAEALQLSMGQQRLSAYDTFLEEKGGLLRTLAVPAAHSQQIAGLEQMTAYLLSGQLLILAEGSRQCLAVNVSGGERRPVSEPATETVVRGPREGFTESIETNLALLRRKIKNPNLWIENRQIGRISQTDVAIMYLNGIAKEEVVKEVRARLDAIDIDAILESGNIEEMIEDRKASVIPTIISTERPDVVASGILEGRVAIFVDGTPFVLMVPVFFIQFFQAAEDYYNRYTFSVLRVLRMFAFGISLLGPSLYVALTTFHQEAIPTPLLISLAAQREGVPFPALVEALIMEITFEILREAGVRMPRTIGQAVSIVGALVLGEAAVQAGLVSPAMVIVVSLTAISNFVIPVYNLALAVSMMRFIFMILAATFGFFGISAGLVALLLHLCSLRSFGVPFMSPFAPMSFSGLRDSWLRFPIYWQKFRPPFLSPKNQRRMNDNVSEGEQNN
ncbi:spore germination protein [Paenibacillus sp. GCM10027626]|uniref:spore germination protein n=1 Tax=Paenibacillus sp. GCM10027626 TaxID=3273411 RepID=UPI00363FE250